MDSVEPVPVVPVASVESLLPPEIHSLLPTEEEVAEIVVREELAAKLAADAEESLPAAVVPEVNTWTGNLTRGSVRALMREARTPGFDAEEAVRVLDALWDGVSLVQYCRRPGVSVRRGTVKAWAVLVPEFGELLREAEEGLGGYWRDLAGEAVAEGGEGDPQLAGARLKVAAAYDARIRSGESGGGGVGVTVQVVKFGEGG